MFVFRTTLRAGGMYALCTTFETVVGGCALMCVTCTDSRCLSVLPVLDQPHDHHHHHYYYGHETSKLVARGDFLQWPSRTARAILKHSVEVCSPWRKVNNDGIWFLSCVYMCYRGLAVVVLLDCGCCSCCSCKTSMLRKAFCCN
jgi:hypothetical protein